MHFRYLQIPASVISSVGTVNYHQQPPQQQHHQQQQAHQLIFVSPYSKNETSNNPTTVQNLPIVLSTTSSLSNNCNSNNNSNQVDGNVKIKMIQQSTNVQHPRLHPKKRKFDLAELEDDVPTSSSSSSSNACNNQETSQANKSYEGRGGVNVNGNGTLDAPVVPTSNHATSVATSQYMKVSRETEHFTKKPFTSNYR